MGSLGKQQLMSLFEVEQFEGDTSKRGNSF